MVGFENLDDHLHTSIAVRRDATDIVEEAWSVQTDYGVAIVGIENRGRGSALAVVGITHLHDRVVLVLEICNSIV